MKLDNNIKIIGILLVVCGALFYKVMFTEHLFLSSDSLSAKSVSQGINISTQEHGEYPIWMPWMFGGLPSTHSMQNISEYYFPHQVISSIKFLGIPWFWNFVLHFLFCGFGMYLLLKKLKLGFMSADFGNHPGGFFTLSTLRELRKKNFEIVAYSTKDRSDDLSSSFRSLF